MPEKIIPYKTIEDALGEVRLVSDISVEEYLETLRARAQGDVSFLVYTRVPRGVLVKADEYKPVEVCADGEIEAVRRDRNELRGVSFNFMHGFGDFIVTGSGVISEARVCIQTQNDAHRARILVNKFGWGGASIECKSLSTRQGIRGKR